MATQTPTIRAVHLQNELAVGNASATAELHRRRLILSQRTNQSNLRLLLSYFDRFLQFTGCRTPVEKTTFLLPTPELLTQTDSSWIFTTVRAPIIAVKISKHKELLEDEYNVHVRIESMFTSLAGEIDQLGKSIVLPFIPHCFEFHPKLISSKYSNIRENEKCIPLDSAAYTMEFIRPFHKNHISYLIKRHLSWSVQDRALAGVTSSHFTAKICLGDIQPLSDKWQVGLNDRPAYLDQLHAEGVDISRLSAAMGYTLAILHWHCGIDGGGVEFVLGCGKKGNVRFWLTNFANCKPFEYTTYDVKTRLVDAVMGNDSSWPRWIHLRPFRNIWSRFRRSYIQMSLLLCGEHDNEPTDDFLPGIFIKELEKLRGRRQQPESSRSYVAKMRQPNIST